ncbi:MAG TPA: efflux RND transporter periplasmic adaptor subunit [Terriglobia bacterium]|nr:efflux RND transporter periplasmic adaptor subunit [Terriglobia bacterium]
MKSIAFRHRYDWAPILAGIMICFLVAVFLAACARRGSGNTKVDAAESSPNSFSLPADRRGVSVAEVTTERLPDYLVLQAQIQADPTRVVRVYAPVSGRLASVDVRPADVVSQGQPLAVVASSDVAAARQAYQQALADNAVKQSALARSKLLLDHHAIAEKDYEQAEADAHMSAAALASAVERLNLLNVGINGSSDELVVRAPRSGVVVSLGAAAGEFAKSLDNSDPLCTIADLTTIWAVGEVYEKDLASVRVGNAADVTVSAYPGQTWRGRITAVASIVDPVTRTLSVRVVLPNPGLELKPDMFASIRLVRALRDYVIAPSAAVLREGTSDYVYVEDSAGHFARCVVTLGQYTGADQVEITSGIVPGSKIVVEGADLLRPVS